MAIHVLDADMDMEQKKVIVVFKQCMPLSDGSVLRFFFLSNEIANACQRVAFP